MISLKLMKHWWEACVAEWVAVICIEHSSLSFFLIGSNRIDWSLYWPFLKSHASISYNHMKKVEWVYLKVEKGLADRNAFCSAFNLIIRPRFDFICEFLICWKRVVKKTPYSERSGSMCNERPNVAATALRWVRCAPVRKQTTLVKNFQNPRTHLQVM